MNNPLEPFRLQIFHGSLHCACVFKRVETFDLLNSFCVTVATVCIFQAFFMFVPIIFIVQDQPTALLFGCTYPRTRNRFLTSSA